MPPTYNSLIAIYLDVSYGVIYGLHDPQTGELRYIGQTIKRVPDRLAVHVSPSQLRRHSYLARWLWGLVRRGLSPTWSVLAEARDQAELDRLEVELIARARAERVRLVNLSDGGGGRAGYIPSQDEREKIAASQRGVPKPKHTEEWRVRMSNLMTGRNTNTSEHMARLAEMKRGVPRSAETKAKISAARKGQPSHMAGKHHTDEAKAKISANRTGKVTGAWHHAYRNDVQTSEILRLLGEGKTKVEIAVTFGVSPTFVHRRLSQARRDGAVPSMAASS